MKSIGNSHERVDERIRTGKPLSRATIDVVDAKLLDQAHLYVLRNTSVVEPYIEQHMLELKELNPRVSRNSTWLQSQHSRTFISWLKKEVEKRVCNGEDICSSVRWLAKGPSFAVVFGDMDLNHDEDSNLQKPASDHDEETKSQRGPTIKPKANKGKTMITYNKRGVPIRDGAKKLTTFEGMTARTMVPITFDSWIQMQETGKTEEEIDRATLWKKARELKTGGFDSNVQEIVDKIDELQNSGCFESCGTHDVLTEALGTEEQRGHVRGLGKYVKPHQYFYEPKTVKQYLDTEKKKVDERFNKLEEEVEKLKRGVINVSEAASCQMGGYEDDLEDKPHEESLDNSCYLAVDVASNIVAKGAIMKYSDSGEIIEVMMEICVQGEAFLPIPLEEELIMKVKDAVGHILSWPRHLVIRCSDLVNTIYKLHVPSRTREVVEKENAKENGKENAKKDDAIVENKKEIGKEKENEKKDDERVENKKERGKEKENEKELLRRRMTRAQRKTRIRIENNVLLRMTAMMVDGQVSKVDSIKVQCEDGLYGYESYTYLTWDDFQAVFTLEELTGAVITSYTMYLFEQIKNGSKRDHGICFVSPTASSPQHASRTGIASLYWPKLQYIAAVTCKHIIEILSYCRMKAILNGG
ncbi:hypothetical protein L1987_64142 [Smallanthus sonchifolius]|uniref:Uncharacterized protein n=1 Tax=Smallanthus sonchifolius TaxID=185202 RepID=A0ACB9CFB2_9ASTR|nr:hypothetical protein L1987_64142 [Smallanthus sonchifolius]